jgi:hypothetical protein
VSSDGVIVNKELEKIWKVLRTKFKIVFQHLPGEKNPKENL